MKIVTPTHWAVFHQNVDDDVFTALGGIYEVSGSVYTEHIDFSIAPQILGVAAPNEYQIADDRWTIKSTPDNTFQLREVWKRVE